jgi:hypothetical protein
MGVELELAVFHLSTVSAAAGGGRRAAAAARPACSTRGESTYLCTFI